LDTAAARSTISLSSTRPIRVRPWCVKVASFTALLLMAYPCLARINCSSEPETLSDMHFLRRCLWHFRR
jgi:hypothetical protein